MTRAGEAVAAESAAASTPAPPLPTAWQAVILLCLIGFLYYAVIGKLVHDWWMDPNFSHGFFVPLFSGFLIWTQREQLAKVPRRPAWSGFAVILAALILLILGNLGIDLFLTRVSLVGLLAGLVIFFGGWAVFRAVFFAWAFLILMIPIPAIVLNQVTFPLQLLASRLASEILPVFSVPVLREGNVIQLPAMRLEVAEACSGIRSLLSLTTLALIYGYFLDPKIWRRILLALAAVPIAVVANAMRVVGTGVAVQYWDADKALGFFHEFSGWVIFVVLLFLLFAVHGAIRLLSARLGKSQ